MRPVETRWRTLWTSALALMLQVIPLPMWPAAVRPPPFAVLVLLAWSMVAPQLGGVGLGFALGLALDVWRGAVLGQHALATALIAYVTIRQRLIIRSKPVFEQTLLVAGLLLLWEIVVWAIDGWTGHSTTGWTRWLPVLTGSMLWPVASALFAVDGRSSRRGL
jgi:rod shape-determining protein MreD